MSRERTRTLSTRLRKAPTRYEPVSRIAVGGMAEVLRAKAIFDDGEAIDVAIKRVLPAIQEPVFRDMFRDEARLGQLLSHPNIVRVYDARDIDGTYIMVMELVDGDSLRSLFRDAMKRNATMPVPVALYIVQQVAMALAFAHNAKGPKGDSLGIVHRDVSPHNVLLGRDGAVKLTDFGLADSIGNAAVRKTGMIGGKMGYLSPEVIQKKPSDRRVDIFALGIMLWEMLGGRRLFYAKSDAQTVRNIVRCEVPSLFDINRQVPVDVDRLLERMLAPDPDTRLSNVADVASGLADILNRIDQEVGARDVALMINLHMAKRVEAKGPSPVVAQMLVDELQRFAVAAAGAPTTIGSAPLNPSDFEPFGR